MVEVTTCTIYANILRDRSVCQKHATVCGWPYEQCQTFYCHMHNLENIFHHKRQCMAPV